MSLEIFPAHSPEQFKTVAQLHEQGISEGFLSTMGKPFLRSLYKGIANVEGCGVLIAQNDDQVLGFISYTRDVNSCYKSILRKNWLSLTLTMLPNIFNPTIYKKVFETLSYPSHQEKSSRPMTGQTTGKKRAELLSMAVSQTARGQGVGKQLVAALDEIMIKMNSPEYYVVTHGVDTRSNGFYMGRGFIKTRDFNHHGKPMIEYYKELATINLPPAK